MNNITFSDTKNIDLDILQHLFLSVEWESGNYPKKLAKAISNFSTVYSAWDGDSLVGLICAFDDQNLNAYIQYLLVEPNYQGHGIGSKLMELLMEKYSDFNNISLLSYKNTVKFYETLGFERDDDAIALSCYRFTTNPRI